MSGLEGVSLETDCVNADFVLSARWETTVRSGQPVVSSGQQTMLSSTVGRRSLNVPFATLLLYVVRRSLKLWSRESNCYDIDPRSGVVTYGLRSGVVSSGLRPVGRGSANASRLPQ